VLSHEIIKFKEKIVAPSGPWTTRSHYENTSNIKCQEDLEEFLKAEHIKVGDFIRYTNGGSGVYSAYQINIVLYVQHEFSKCTIGYTRFPETHLILQCNITEHQPWIRWVDIREYIPITPEDKERMVNDKLLDYIETVKSTAPLYQEATA